MNAIANLYRQNVNREIDLHLGVAAVSFAIAGLGYACHQAFGYAQNLEGMAVVGVVYLLLAVGSIRRTNP